MQDEESKSNLYECNICLETASEPVITPCGHLFCWPCIYSVYSKFLICKIKTLNFLKIVVKLQPRISFMSSLQKRHFHQGINPFVHKRRWKQSKTPSFKRVDIFSAKIRIIYFNDYFRRRDPNIPQRPLPQRQNPQRNQNAIGNVNFLFISEKKTILLIEWKFHQYEHRHESPTWSAVGGIWVFPFFIQSPFPSWQQNRWLWDGFNFKNPWFIFFFLKIIDQISPEVSLQLRFKLLLGLVVILMLLVMIFLC